MRRVRSLPLAAAVGLGIAGTAAADTAEVTFSGFVSSFTWNNITSTASAIPGHEFDLGAPVSGIFTYDTTAAVTHLNPDGRTAFYDAIRSFRLTVTDTLGNPVEVEADFFAGSMDIEFLPGVHFPLTVQTQVEDNAEAIVIGEPDPIIIDGFSFNAANMVDYPSSLPEVEDDGMGFALEWGSQSNLDALSDVVLPAAPPDVLDPLRWDRVAGWVRVAADAIMIFEVTEVSLTVTATPCPCEVDQNAAAVDVFDLLAYLDLWFAGDAAAERNGDDPVVIDVFDLLAFLDCWFPASAGAPCS